MLSLFSGWLGRIIWWFVLSALLQTAQADAPQVTVSIKPLHSLVAGVMQGVAEPDLLIPAGQSPHEFSLRPSDMRKLSSAAMIVWLGESFETPLAHALHRSQEGRRSIALLEQPGIFLLPARQGGVWEKRERSEVDGSHHHADDIDPHIWLSTRNAVQIVQILRDALIEIDPANRPRYQVNAQRLLVRLEQLEKALEAGLSKVRDIPFIVFHDAYQYFQQQFGLRAVGSITIGPERQPGARRIHEIHAKLQRLEARCVFSEPQFEPKLLRMLIQDTQVRSGTLDPIGADLQSGPDAYFLLLKNLQANLVGCLEESP